MVNGSFKGLYTFIEVAKIYNIDDSCLRKQVARGKLIIDEDVKKMGSTWIITEQAMLRNFGDLKFKEYKSRISHTVARQHSCSKDKSKKLSTQVLKSKGSRSKNKVHSINEKEEKTKDSWVQDDIKGIELKSFKFNTQK